MFKFSNWTKLSEIGKLDKFPGVYIIAYSEKNISGKPFKKEIIYIGMTNSRGGLQRRLTQFDNTLRNNANNHSGARRIRERYSNYDKLAKKLYISTQTFKCNVLSDQAKDFLIMGDVVKHEYTCFAEYIKRFRNGLPKFNKRHT